MEYNLKFKKVSALRITDISNLFCNYYVQWKLNYLWYGIICSLCHFGMIFLDKNRKSRKFRIFNPFSTTIVVKLSTSKQYFCSLLELHVSIFITWITIWNATNTFSSGLLLYYEWQPVSDLLSTIFFSLFLGFLQFIIFTFCRRLQSEGIIFRT